MTKKCKVEVKRPLILALASAFLIPGAFAQSAGGAQAPVALPTVSNHSQAIVAQTPETIEVIGVREQRDFGDSIMSLNRLPADLKDIPQSVIVIDRAVMDSQGATSLASALRNVPGLTIGGAEGGLIGTNINLNGFSARTDLFLDGARDRGQYYRDTFSLQAIEVLMGPSSLLFGRGSTGGAINQVSKTPSLKTTNEVQFSAMSTGLVRTVMDSNVKMTETSAFRVSAMGQTGSPNNRDQSNMKDAGIAPSFKFGIGEPTTITLSALMQHNNDQVDYGIPNLNGGFVNVNRNSAYGYSDDRTISDVMSLNAVVEHKLSSTGKIRNQTNFTRVLTNAQETSPNTLGILLQGRGFLALPSASAAAIPAALTTNLPLTDLWVRQQSRDRNIQDNSIFNLTEFSDEFKTGQIKHNILVGFEMSQDTYNSQGFYRNGTCGNIALNPPGGTSGYVNCTPLLNPGGGVSPDNIPKVAGNLATGTATDFGLYVSDTIELDPSFKLVAGLRGDRYSATVGNSIFSATTPTNADQTINYLSVRGGAIWQPTTTQSYYLSYSTSFNPSLEQLTNTTGGTAPLPPQESRAYEVGGRWDFNAGKLSLTGALFQITQYNARAQDSLGIYTATGTVQVNGARLGVVGRLTDKFQIFGGYSLLNATIVNGIAPGTEGNTPANTPKNSGSLWGVYAVTPEWEVGGGATYSGQRYANNANLTEVGSYVRFDATLAYHQPKYDVRLNLYNLANTSYYDALIPSDGGRAVPGLGRSAMVTLSVRF